MNAKEYLTRQFESMRHLVDSATQALSDELLNTSPPGTANTAGLTWLHLIDTEDQFVAQLQARDPIWIKDGWEKRIGLNRLPRYGQDWRPLQAVSLTVADLQIYQQSVREHTSVYLEQLVSEDLAQTVTFYGRPAAVVDVLVLMISHSLFHAGELSALQGIQGAKGLPF